MRIDIQTDPDDHRSPIKAPPNYQSPRMRLKLLSLFGALILVLILMQEAKKPERWQWMGFEQQPAPNPNAVRQKAENEQDFLLAEPDELANLIAGASATNFDAQDYPIASQQFWRDTFAGLSNDGQRRLFRLLRAINQRSALDPANLPEFEELVSTLEKKRDRFHVRLMDQISYLADDSTQKKQLNDELFESKKYWHEKVLPAWQSSLQGKDITMAQQKAIQALYALLGELAMEQVEDGSSLNRPDEGSAWLVAWERVFSSSTQPPPTLVTHVQLSSQPVAYRGKPATVNGWIRSARKLNVTPNELGLSNYYVLWVRPEDTNVGPYCVYAQRLPEGFPDVSTSDVELNERVQISGVFFKIRSYTAANGEVLQCPLILADSFEWKPVTAEIPIDSWTPPVWLIIVFLIAMPILAGFIAWWAYTSTETRRFVHGPNTQKEIDKTLVDLEEDPEIKSDLQRVQSLYDSDLENPND